VLPTSGVLMFDFLDTSAPGDDQHPLGDREFMGVLERKVGVSARQTPISFHVFAYLASPSLSLFLCVEYCQHVQLCALCTWSSALPVIKQVSTTITQLPSQCTELCRMCTGGRAVWRCG
jgi:hypothetical protein